MDEVRYRPIGVVHSPFKAPGEAPRQPRFGSGIRGSIEILPEYVDGLPDLEGFSHIVLLCHLHLVDGYSLSVMPPWGDKRRSLFATRTPRRPNPIGLSVVRLEAIEGGTLHVADLDMLDGTPVLDIKPYVAPFDGNQEPTQGWMAGKIRGLPQDETVLEGES
jgi:tRNA-Thr(GGU) m(6)t(6)A37 methyltransferase TsaA